MSPLLRRTAAPALGVIACAVLLSATRGLDDVVPGRQLGPAFWPRMVLAGLAAACVARIASAARASRRARDADHGPRATPDGSSTDAPPPISWPKLVVALVLVFGYVVAAPRVGFPVATAGFVAGFMALCGARSAFGIGATAAVGAVALLYLFVKAVYLPLPKGDGPFEALTLALYRALRIF